MINYDLFFAPAFNTAMGSICIEIVKLTSLTLEQQEPLIKQAGIWATKNWQHIFPTIENWEEDVRQYKEHFYFALYANQPIGMFALKEDKEYKSYEKPLTVKSLFYVYVDERVRGIRVASQLLNHAVKIAKETNTDLIIGATTKPALNALYRKYGCHVVCESEFYGQTVSNLAFDVARQLGKK